PPRTATAAPPPRRPPPAARAGCQGVRSAVTRTPPAGSAAGVPDTSCADRSQRFLPRLAVRHLDRRATRVLRHPPLRARELLVVMPAFVDDGLREGEQLPCRGRCRTAPPPRTVPR